jgi:hypothetical protein
MRDECNIIQYYRSFNLLSKPLLGAERIMTDEHNITFLLGFLLGFHLNDHKAL